MKVALTAMALGVGLYLIPLALIANPMILQLAEDPVSALLTFLQLAVGLSAISFGLIGYRKPVQKILVILFGCAVTFAGLALSQ